MDSRLLTDGHDSTPLPSPRRSQLFHAIVVAGAALGAACGGRTGIDAGRDGATPRTTGNDAAKPADAFAREAEVDSAPEATADARPDVRPDAPVEAAHDAHDGGVCSQPDSNGMRCPLFPDAAFENGCCVGGQCFPCFV